MVTCVCVIAVAWATLSSSIVKVLGLGFFMYHADAGWIYSVVCFYI